MRKLNIYMVISSFCLLFISCNKKNDIVSGIFTNQKENTYYILYKNKSINPSYEKYEIQNEKQIIVKNKVFNKLEIPNNTIKNFDSLSLTSKTYNVHHDFIKSFNLKINNNKVFFYDKEREIHKTLPLNTEFNRWINYSLNADNKVKIDDKNDFVECLIVYKNGVAQTYYNNVYFNKDDLTLFMSVINAFFVLNRDKGVIDQPRHYPSFDSLNVFLNKNDIGVHFIEPSP